MNTTLCSQKQNIFALHNIIIILTFYFVRFCVGDGYCYVTENMY